VGFPTSPPAKKRARRLRGWDRRRITRASERGSSRKRRQKMDANGRARRWVIGRFGRSSSPTTGNDITGDVREQITRGHRAENEVLET